MVCGFHTAGYSGWGLVGPGAPKPGCALVQDRGTHFLGRYHFGHHISYLAALVLGFEMGRGADHLNGNHKESNPEHGPEAVE